ncbi:MAG: hypothetical protein ACYTE8_01210 [Planctomycetota bacterium]|jgi:hypothetical protein
MKNKEKEKYFEGLPASAAAFIELVIKKMRYRRKVRREVLTELAGHFKDALRDCKTKEEKEKEAEKLIETFGDAKMLGVLLKRAKKRCRPLWRTAVARLFQTAGVLIICLVVYVAWFLTGKPAVTVDYLAQWNQLIRPAADESLNAAPLYLEAVEQIKEVSDEFLKLFLEEYRQILEEIKTLEEVDPENERIVSERFPHPSQISSGLDLCDEIERFLLQENRLSLTEQRQEIDKKVTGIMIRFFSEPYNEITSSERNLAENWIYEHQQAIEILIAGTEKPYYWRQNITESDTDGLISVLMPNLRNIRNLARALCWRAQIKAEGEQYEKAFNDLIGCFRFGMHIRSGDKTLVEQLVGIGIQAVSVERIRQILSEFQIDAEQLAFLQEEFEKGVSDEQFMISLEVERLFMYDEIQRCFTDERFGGGHIYLSRLAQLSSNKIGYSGENYITDILSIIETTGRWPIHILFTHPNKRETKETADRMYDYITDVYRKTPAQLRTEGIDINKEAMEIAKGNILLEMFLPPLGRVFELSYRNKIDVEATLTIVALKRYKKDVGEYPESLGELVSKDYLKEVPIDPFSGEKIAYKRRNGDFILYGVGENFEDNGGKVVRDDDGRIIKFSDEGDWIFWPTEIPESEEERLERIKSNVNSLIPYSRGISLEEDK